MTRLFIGGLNDTTSRLDLEREFESFGRIEDVFVARNPPGFGFIVYEKPRDAEEAIKEMDGQVIFGSKIRVEHARERGAGRGGGGYRGGDMSNVKCYNCGGYGHMSRECTNRVRSYGFGGGGGGGGRRRSRSRSRSREQERRPRRRSPSRSRSPSRERYRR